MKPISFIKSIREVITEVYPCDDSRSVSRGRWRTISESETVEDETVEDETVETF